jgi:hypothetical protein
MMTPPAPPAPTPVASYQPTGGYYDPYSGTYIPGSANVDAMTNQFSAMNMQSHHQQWMPPHNNATGIPMGQMHHGGDDRNRRQGYGNQGNPGARSGMQQPRPHMQQPHQQAMPPNMAMNYPPVDNRMYNNRPPYVQHAPMSYGRPQYPQDGGYQPQYDNRGATTYYSTDASGQKMGEGANGEEPNVSDA